MYHTLYEAGILVLIVIMVFLQNWRATLVPATTVPVTIIGAFAAMALLGFTVNLMTLFALILAIGIVVDDAIVIVENASHYIEKGLSPHDAAIKAMSELTGPVIGITLVLTSVFLPAAFMPGITGQLFRQFALVIASTAVISALNALTLKPAQCALYLRPQDPNKKPNAFYRGFNRGYGVVEKAYVDLVALDGGPHRAHGRWCFSSLSAWAACSSPSTPPAFCPRKTRATPLSWACCPKGPPNPGSRRLPTRVDAILQADPGGRFLGDHGRLFHPGHRQRLHDVHHLCHLRGLGQTRRRLEPGAYCRRPAAGSWPACKRRSSRCWCRRPSAAWGSPAAFR